MPGVRICAKAIRERAASCNAALFIEPVSGCEGGSVGVRRQEKNRFGLEKAEEVVTITCNGSEAACTALALLTSSKLDDPPDLINTA
uniref:Uncharacterized protein n=1 Tax=Knipowitschia caucasica TaxID=637954 RepID=A0AAV2J7H8_KNICA